MSQEKQGGILGGLEHIAHRKVDDLVEKFVAKLPVTTKRFLARNRTWLIGGLDILATLTGFLRPNNPKWDVIQTSFSSLVEGLEKASKDAGMDNLSRLDSNITGAYLESFNESVISVGLLSADSKDSKNIASWIMSLQKNNSDLAKKAYQFIGSMTPRDLMRFAQFTNSQKMAMLEASLPKEKEVDGSVLDSFIPFIEMQRDSVDELSVILEKKVRKAEKKLKAVRKKSNKKDEKVEKRKIIKVCDSDILSKESSSDTGGWEW